MDKPPEAQASEAPETQPFTNPAKPLACPTGTGSNKHGVKVMQGVKVLQRAVKVMGIVGRVKGSTRIKRGRKEDFELSDPNASPTEHRNVQASKDFHLEENKDRPVHTELTGHTGRTKACCVFADGTKLLTCSDDNTLRIFNLTSGECETILGCDRSELLEHRRNVKWFPENLGPFGIQETMLRPHVNFAELCYELDAEQAELFKKRGQLSSELWTELMKGDSGLCARISKPHRITLTDDERVPYGIPLRATHFAWGHQVEAAEKLTGDQVMELGGESLLSNTGDVSCSLVFVFVLNVCCVLNGPGISAEASFAVNGGFVYINAEGRGEDWSTWSDGPALEIQANAICVTGLVTLHFSEKITIDMKRHSASLKRMREEGRFQRITIVPLRLSGGMSLAM